jgi:hypothetical protein
MEFGLGGRLPSLGLRTASAQAFVSVLELSAVTCDQGRPATRTTDVELDAGVSDESGEADTPPGILVGIFRGGGAMVALLDGATGGTVFPRPELPVGMLRRALGALGGAFDGALGAPVFGRPGGAFAGALGAPVFGRPGGAFAGAMGAPVFVGACGGAFRSVRTAFASGRFGGETEWLGATALASSNRACGGRYVEVGRGRVTPSNWMLPTDAATLGSSSEESDDEPGGPTSRLGWARRNCPMGDSSVAWTSSSELEGSDGEPGGSARRFG